MTKTLGGGDAKSKAKKKQQQPSNLQAMHNNNKSGGGGNSSSSGSDSSDSSSSSSDESESDSENESKMPASAAQQQKQNSAAASQQLIGNAVSAANNLGPGSRPNVSTPKLPNNSSNNDAALGNNIKVRNDLMPGGGGGRLSGNTTPNSIGSNSGVMPSFPAANFATAAGGAVSQQPLQAVRPFPPAVSTTPQQSPTQQLLQQAKANVPGPLSHLSTAMNNSNSLDIPSLDSPAAPQKTKAMLKGWTSLAGPTTAGAMGTASLPMPSMTGTVASLPTPVNTSSSIVAHHHPIPAAAAVGPPPEHPSSRSSSSGNGGGGGGSSSSNVSKSQVLQQKASDTFNAFRKAAQEKTERERQLKEQQETVRLKKEAAERERKRQEHERKMEMQEVEMLEQARRSMSIGRASSGGGVTAAGISAILGGPTPPTDNGNGNSSGISPPGMSPGFTSEAERARLERQRAREKEQERRRREAKAGGIDMNMQSDLMAAFEENII